MVVSGTYPTWATSAGGCSRRCRPSSSYRGPEVAGSVMDIVLGEIQRDEPGQQSVLDRWLDLALITTLRAWFARSNWRNASASPARAWPGGLTRSSARHRCRT